MSQIPYSNQNIEPTRETILAELYNANSLNCITPYLNNKCNFLEIGPRQGQLAETILQLIGPEGNYTGIEANVTHAAQIRERLNTYKNVNIIHDPISNCIDSLPKESFDVIYFRWFLWTIPAAERISLVNKLFNLLKPNGVLLAEEADMTAIKSIPAHTCIEQFKKYTAMRCEANQQPLTLGLEMKDLFHQTGLRLDISNSISFQPETSNSSLKLLPFYSAISTQPACIEAGAEIHEYEQMINELKSLAEDNATRLFSTKNIFTAATKKD